MSEARLPERYAGFHAAMHQTSTRIIEPSLRASSGTSVWFPWQRAKPKVLVLQVGQNGVFEAPSEFLDPALLQSHLDKQKQQFNITPQCSVYILEALSSEFTSILGSHFQLHPALFMDHERLVSFNNRATGEGGGIPFLPSSIHGRDYVSLKYHEPLLFSTLPTGFRNLCDVSGRHIAVTRLMGKFSDVVIARRKCTFWSRRTEAGGWDCLIICDPPLKGVLTNYSDFVAQKDQIKCGEAPPRTSFLDDIAFYIQNHSGALNLHDHGCLRTFVEKIIACHYLKLAEFLQTIIETIQFNLSRQQDFTSFTIAPVEEQWSDVQALGRRAGEYTDDLAAIMLQLRIPFEPPNMQLTTDWINSAPDYQYLYLLFKEIGRRSTQLNSSTSALVGLTNNRQATRAQEIALQATEQSILEAKSVKALTLLGVTFVPLAYIASLFSMSGPFQPGGRLFWVYFATSLPLIGLVFFGYLMLGTGRYRGGMQRSLGTITTAV